MPPADYDRWKFTVHEALSTDGELNVEYRAIWPDASVHWVEIRARTQFDPQRNPLILSGVSIDITQRKENDQCPQLMTQEMGHGIKNILANVQSVVNQSLRAEKGLNELRVDIDQLI
ncbi:PAS domain-containing protein [Ochrobactrum sp. EDr1-4]|uniref:PAS domain-containing protein n=1 Tax=unclassified Ochrobactrum TaxID=239106 RepID=UPI003BA2E59C